MIGWSWILLTGVWIGAAGTLGAVAAFLVGGVAVILIALTYAELVAAMPKAGGEHVYSHRALGPGGAFVCTWAIVLGYVSVVAFEAVALPFALMHFFPAINTGYLWTISGWDVHIGFVAIGIVAAILLTGANILGIKPAAAIQGIATSVILIVGVVFLGGVGLSGSPANMQPLFTDGMGGILSVLIMVPMLFVGFDVIPQAAEEINLPHAKIGSLLIVSVLIALVWYTAMVIGVGLVMPDAGRAVSNITTAEASALAWGAQWGGAVLVIGGIAGILTSWNAFLVGGSRAIYALAGAGMLPAWLARLHPRYQTPHLALLLIGCLSCFAPWFGRPVLVWLIDAGSFGITIAYMFVVLSFLVLRKKEPDMPRPYRVRHGRVVGGMALLLSFGIFLLFLPGSPAALRWPEEWIICFAWSALGGLLFVASRRKG